MNLLQAKNIARAIEKDIEGRKGIGDELDMIDPEIREEMISKWINLIITFA